MLNENDDVAEIEGKQIAVIDALKIAILVVKKAQQGNVYLMEIVREAMKIGNGHGEK